MKSQICSWRQIAYYTCELISIAICHLLSRPLLQMTMANKSDRALLDRTTAGDEINCCCCTLAASGQLITCLLQHWRKAHNRHCHWCRKVRVHIIYVKFNFPFQWQPKLNMCIIYKCIYYTWAFTINWWYWDSISNTAGENLSIFFLIRIYPLSSATTRAAKLCSKNPPVLNWGAG